MFFEFLNILKFMIVLEFMNIFFYKCWTFLNSQPFLQLIFSNLNKIFPKWNKQVKKKVVSFGWWMGARLSLTGPGPCMRRLAGTGGTHVSDAPLVLEESDI